MSEPVVEPKKPLFRAGSERASVAIPDAPRGLSIVDFLTDGSLLSLCDELSRLSGLDVSLRDASGRVIEPAPQPERWRAGPVRALRAGAFEAPLVIEEGQRLGSLVIEGDLTRLPEDQHRSMQRVVELIGQVTRDFCGREDELRQTVREVQALFRLSSLLARATDADAVLSLALELALDVMGLDAGSVVLFEHEQMESAENEGDLVLKASSGLSREWLDNPKPASKGRLFDRLALRGEVVVSTDLLKDERVQLRAEVKKEGLRAFINSGLVFQDRPLGVIRLYAKKPRVFTAAERRLVKSIALQAAVAIQQARLLRVEREDAKLRRQLQLAASVQRRMLPHGVPSFPRVDLAMRYEPSSDLGGDFYDVFDLSGNLALAIGDVVGKGLAAALLMSAVRATLRAHVQDVYHIDDVMARVNKALCRDTLQSEFATAFYGVIEPTTLRLTFCSAGHDPPMLLRASGRPPSVKDIEELSTGGMAVGIDPAQKYSRETIDLRPGDTLLAYTDGMTDAMDASGKRFGRPALRQLLVKTLAENPTGSAGFVMDRMFAAIRDHSGGREKTDDQTALVLRVR
jgi:phosphoserine phosphatase RsbU/P